MPLLSLPLLPVLCPELQPPRSRAPSVKPNAHPQNEEYCPVAINTTLSHKKQEELSGHTGRASKRQRVRRYFSRCSCSKVEPVQEEGPARSCLGFFCIIMSSIVASSTVLGPTSRACREIYSPGRTGSSYEKLRPERGYSYRPRSCCQPLVHRVRTHAPEPAPRRAGPSGLTGPCTGCRDSISDSGPERWEWEPRQGWRLLPECARTSAFATAHRAVPAGAPFPKSSRLSHRGPSRDVTSPDAILHSGIHFAPCSVEPLLARSIFGSGTSSSDPPMTLAAKPWEVDAQERSRRARRLLVQAPLWAPSMSERDIFLAGIAELPDFGETVPARWPEQEASEHQLSPTQPVLLRAC